MPLFRPQFWASLKQFPSTARSARWPPTLRPRAMPTPWPPWPTSSGWAASCATARAAIGKVIYGQQHGHRSNAGCAPVRRSPAADRRARASPRPSWSRRWASCWAWRAKRIQFTPDLMPADILGSEVLEESDIGHRSFRFIQGPVFAQLLMADEINRASPRTQSALLQSMQEKHVTVAGKRYDLPAPVPRARDAEPAGAGRHLSPARGAARPLPAAGRCRLSRRGRRARDHDRHHQRQRAGGGRRR